MGIIFLRLTSQGTRLYSSIENTRMVRVYNTTNGNSINHFEITSGNARGVAFDPQGNLHVSTWGKNVEIFTADGHKIREITFSEVSSADGILIDGASYTIIADRDRGEVLVFNHNNSLFKKIVGFGQPMGVAMSYQCGYLLVADYGRGTYML